MATALEQSFAELCEKHELTCLAVNYHSGVIHAGSEFTVYAHGGGFLGSAARHTIAEALGAAIVELAARGAEAIPLADEPLVAEPAQ